MSTQERIKQEAKAKYPPRRGMPKLSMYRTDAYIAGALSERNKTIEEAKQKLSELGFTIDDYNGRLIFNTLESLKV